MGSTPVPAGTRFGWQLDPQSGDRWNLRLDLPPVSDSFSSKTGFLIEIPPVPSSTGRSVSGCGTAAAGVWREGFAGTPPGSGPERPLGFPSLLLPPTCCAWASISGRRLEPYRLGHPIRLPDGKGLWRLRMVDLRPQVPRLSWRVPASGISIRGGRGLYSTESSPHSRGTGVESTLGARCRGKSPAELDGPVRRLFRPSAEPGNPPTG